MQVPLEIQIASVKRELRLRRRNYPRWVAGGRMRQGDADREIAAMAGVLATLESLRPPEPKVLPCLFPDLVDAPVAGCAPVVDLPQAPDAPPSAPDPGAFLFPEMSGAQA